MRCDSCIYKEMCISCSSLTAEDIAACVGYEKDETFALKPEPETKPTELDNSIPWWMILIISSAVLYLIVLFIKKALLR